MARFVLVSNGPGELYTWVRPVLSELRRLAPEASVTVSLVPCQFAAGNEPEVAASFQPDAVTTPADYLRSAALGRAPGGVAGSGEGAVIGLGGNASFAVSLGRRLGLPAHRYSFEPHWQRGLSSLMVPDARTRDAAVRRGAPAARVRAVGNLVADAVEAASPVGDPGDPHVLVFAGSREQFALHLVPFMLAVVDAMAPRLPGARFVWPVSRLLSTKTVGDAVAGVEAASLGGVAGRRVPEGVVTPGGALLEMVPEEDRYSHMLAATTAVTIPGTNTLELGVAGVPSVVVLPLNRPEVIPLEGAGHWLGLVPFVGKHLKRQAVRLFVERLAVPVSLPNRMSGEDLMVEVSGRVTPAGVADRAVELVLDREDLARRRTALGRAMPRPGAARTLVEYLLGESGGR